MKTIQQLRLLKIISIYIILFQLLSMNLTAQNQGNIWYFGSYAGVDFNGGPPVALTNSVMDAFETCGSISDAAGNLLFYTDGIQVYNSNHVIMSNGTGLSGGGSSSQGSLILPMPGSTTLYYIFTIVDGGTGSTNYTTVDMSLAGGLGAVTVKNTLMIAANATEKQAAVRQANGVDYWVIQHLHNSDAFYAFPVTAAGVGVPVISNVGTISTGVDFGGNLKASAQGDKIAGTLHGQAAFELFDFDNATGIVSNAIFLGNTYLYSYGICFSPDGTKLYGSDEGDGKITQWDLSSGSAPAIIASATTITTLAGNGGAVQYGPDGKVYITEYNSSYLHVINYPDSLPASCGYVGNGVFLNGKTCRYGLPIYVSDIFNPTISVNSSCLGDSTYFTLSNIGSLAGAQWNFGDTASGIYNTSSIFNPSHYYGSPGTYNVQLIQYFFNGSSDTIYKPVTINAYPIVNLGNDTILCIGQSLTLMADTGYTSYLWQDGSSNSTLTATTSGTYFVSVNNNGCIGTDSIDLQFTTCAAPSIGISASDTNFCEKQCIDFFDLSTNSPVSWQWQFNGASPDTSTAQNPTGICYNSYGNFSVTLIACNASGCDTLTLTNFINEYQNPSDSIWVSNDTLYSLPFPSYQWYEVTSGLIAGATNQYFVPTQFGSYYCVVDDSIGCIATSNTIALTAVPSAIINSQFAIFPNPGNGNFEILFGNSIALNSELRIIDAIGKVVFKTKPDSKLIKLDLNLQNGIYFMEYRTESQSFNQKIIIQH